MGYFNFYFMKKLLSKLFTKRTLIYIIIFLFIIILKSNVFAFDYNSDYYIEWTDSSKGYTYRVCSDNALMLIPKQSNRTALDCLYIYNGDYAQVSVYRNGTLNYEGTGSWILSNTDLNNGIVPTFSHKGDYIAFKYDNSLNSVYEVSQSFSPFITNSSEIPSYTFTDLKINIANMDAVLTGNNIINSFDLVIQHNGKNYTYNINDYIRSYSLAGNSNVNGFHRISIPKYNILQDVTLQENDVLRFYLKHYTINSQNPSQTITDTYNMGSFNVTLSGDSLVNNNINSLNNSVQQTTEAVQQTTEAVEDNTQAIEHLEDTITDDNIETTAEDLPTVEVDNPAEQGIDNIFTSFYNAFCTGQAQHIILPIPYTNKSIDIDPDFLSNLIQDSKFSWIRIFINTLWGYLIGRYIVLDIYKKIDKIKSGNITEVETNNVKEEML